jgi:hypothetical protein
MERVFTFTFRPLFSRYSFKSIECGRQMKSERLGENIILVRVPGIEPRAPVLMCRLVKWLGVAHCRFAVLPLKSVSVNLICCFLYWQLLTFECMLRVTLCTSPFQLTFEILCLMIFLFFIYPFYFSDSCIKTFCKTFHSFFQVHRPI